MTTSISPYQAERKRLFSWHGMARKLVFKQLEQLHSGELVIVEQGTRHTFGTSGDDLKAEMVIQDPQTYSQIVTGGSIGAAESYMTGDWETPNLTRLIQVMVRNMDVMDDMEGGLAALSRPVLKWFHRLNQNNEKGSKRNIAAHYDLGNDFFETFLDPTMMYSSGVFPHKEASMEEASTYKLDLICQKLDLQPNDKVIEIGTGWGGFAIHAAKHYGCHVTTTTISEEQFQWAKRRVMEEGLGHLVTLLKQDYRQLAGRYNKLVSIEMIEAVGWQYYDTFFETCARLLTEDGQMLMQAITITDQRYDQARKNVDFIQRYIFPGSCIPSIQALNQSASSVADFRMVHCVDYAGHYAKTLNAWHQAFKAAEKRVAELGYSETFRRMWEFYLCYCEGGFEERSIGVSHLMFARSLCKNEGVLPN